MAVSPIQAEALCALVIRRKAQPGLPPNRYQDRDILLLDVSGSDDFNGKLSAIL
jgi:hypothetical protein